MVARSDVERNLHVFYQLLEGGGHLLEKLWLDGDVDSYEYLNKSRREVDGVDDREEWRMLQNALDVVGFTTIEQFDLFRIIAAILHIGNIEITSDRTDQAGRHGGIHDQRAGRFHIWIGQLRPDGQRCRVARSDPTRPSRS